MFLTIDGKAKLSEIISGLLNCMFEFEVFVFLIARSSFHTRSFRQRAGGKRVLNNYVLGFQGLFRVQGAGFEFGFCGKSIGLGVYLKLPQPTLLVGSFFPLMECFGTLQKRGFCRLTHAVMPSSCTACTSDLLLQHSARMSDPSGPKV